MVTDQGTRCCIADSPQARSASGAASARQLMTAYDVRKSRAKLQELELDPALCGEEQVRARHTGLRSTSELRPPVSTPSAAMDIKLLLSMDHLAKPLPAALRAGRLQLLSATEHRLTARTFAR